MAEVERYAVCWNRTVGLYTVQIEPGFASAMTGENDRPKPMPSKAVPEIGLAHGQKPWKLSPVGSGEATRSIIHGFSGGSDPINKRRG